LFKILRGIKKIFIHVRSSIKIIFLITIATILILGILSLSYKPMYSVTIKGEFIGYTDNKTKLQKRINEYIENGSEQNTAFIDVEDLPEYSLCLLKRNNPTNDEEIFNKVKDSSTIYYEYYAIVVGTEEKYYVATKDEAESIINQLKEKNSNNVSSLAYTQIHSTEMKDFSDVDTVVAGLYEKKVVVASVSKSSSKLFSSVSYDVPSLGISLIRPISGTITSRFGLRGSGVHTGLDIAGSVGTPIVAAASGTVETVSHSTASYGNCVKISHGNGVETLYAHCSTIYVSEGQYVSQGETIATRGSTGNSTGPHLHFEIRINGSSVNPQNYLY
jgi:murein DD-endopeptidase MepM/ murein hydrolase activator NlpD